LTALPGAGHRPRKRFGQHFLHDPGTVERIVAAIAPTDRDHFVEIGPGEGVLTAPLLATGARVEAVEIDRELAAALPGRLDSPGLQVHAADALRVDFARFGAGPLRLVGNLPYNVSTPLLFHVLGDAPRFADIHVMLQKEVVDRIVAEPGSRQYGRLTVALAARCRRQALFTIRAGAFRPPPRVVSAFVRLVPERRLWSRVASWPAFDQVLGRAFSMRRKQLGRSLAGLFSVAELRALGIDPADRPERLPPEVFVSLANARAAGGGVESAPEEP